MLQNWLDSRAMPLRRALCVRQACRVAHILCPHTDARLGNHAELYTLPTTGTAALIPYENVP